MSEQRPTPVIPAQQDRRSVLTAGVVGVGAVTLGGSLAACGAAEDAQGAADAVSSAAASVSSAAGSLAEAIDATSIPVGGGAIIKDAKVVVTQPTEGEFKAFSAVCPHQGCIVSDVKDGSIECACHGSKFDIATGAVQQGPATQALPGKSVSVGTDGITVK